MQVAHFCLNFHDFTMMTSLIGVAKHKDAYMVKHKVWKDERGAASNPYRLHQKELQRQGQDFDEVKGL